MGKTVSRKRNRKKSSGFRGNLVKAVLKIFSGTTISWWPGVFSADYMQTVIAKF